MFIRIVMRFSLLTGEPGLTLTENIKLQLPSDRIQDSERGFVNIIGKYTNYCICKDLHFFFSFSLRRTHLRYSSEKDFFLYWPGDVMGPALTNLKDLLKMPYGCGEQNMASFAPNIFVLQYFYNTNMDVSRVLDDALRYMRVGRYFRAQISYILVILLITLNNYKLFLFIDA